MNYRIGERARVRSSAHAASRRERSAERRRRRAQAHLERVRSEAPPPPPLRLVVAGAAVLSLTAGLLFGSPLVAAARSWISGESELATISIRGTRRLTLDEVARATGVAPGADVAEIETATVSDRLISEPWISNAAVVSLPTGVLLVEIEERVAAAVVRGGAPDRFLAVDASGTPFADASSGDVAELTRVELAGTPVRDEPSESLAAAIELARRLPELKLPVPTAIAVAPEGDPQGYSLWLPGIAPRIVIGRDRIDERLEALARLLDADLEELGRSESVDLRFAEQAVLRGTTPPEGAAQAATARGLAPPSTARPTG